MVLAALIWKISQFGKFLKFYDTITTCICIVKINFCSQSSWPKTQPPKYTFAVTFLDKTLLLFGCNLKLFNKTTLSLELTAVGLISADADNFSSLLSRTPVCYAVSQIQMQCLGTWHGSQLTLTRNTQRGILHFRLWIWECFLVVPSAIGRLQDRSAHGVFSDKLPEIVCL